MNTHISTPFFLRFTFVFASIIIPLLMPNSVQAHPLSQESEGREYVVKIGDYLSLIAQNELRPEGSWRTIVDATNERAASDSRFVRIDNPSLLRPGQLLWIPGDAKLAVDKPLPNPEPSCANLPVVSPEERLYPSLDEDGLYGYIDIQGEFAIAPRFAVATDFSEGLAVVSEDGENFGYIDTTGDFVIEPQYSDAGYFSQGWAPVRYFDQWFEDEEEGFQLSGFIDCQGNTREFDTLYLRIEPYQGGVARAIDTEIRTIYIDLDGEELLEIQTSALDETVKCMCDDEGGSEGVGEGPGDSIPPSLQQWSYYYRYYR